MNRHNVFVTDSYIYIWKIFTSYITYTIFADQTIRIVMFHVKFLKNNKYVNHTPKQNDKANHLARCSLVELIIKIHYNDKPSRRQLTKYAKRVSKLTAIVDLTG